MKYMATTIVALLIGLWFTPLAVALVDTLWWVLLDHNLTGINWTGTRIAVSVLWTFVMGFVVMFSMDFLP